MSRTLTLTFDTPLDAGGGAKVAELVLREPTLGEMDKATADGKGAYAQTISLLVSVCGVTEKLAGLVPASKRLEAMEFIASFAPSEAEVDALVLGVPHVMELDEPIAIGGAKIEEVTLREPTLSELDRAMRYPTAIGQMAALVAQTGGISDVAARKLPYSRLGEIGKFFRPFL